MQLFLPGDDRYPCDPTEVLNDVGSMKTYESLVDRNRLALKCATEWKFWSVIECNCSEVAARIKYEVHFPNSFIFREEPCWPLNHIDLSFSIHNVGIKIAFSV